MEIHFLIRNLNRKEKDHFNLIDKSRFNIKFYFINQRWTFFPLLFSLQVQDKMVVSQENSQILAG